jgi:ElaB/YqjD/DUF883 family membrane-anchored ribosome-binding protein
MHLGKSEGLGKEVHRLLAEAEDLLRDSTEAGAAKLDAASASARDSLRRVCTHLREAEHELAAGARRVDRTVREHPWETAAVIGVAAFLLGYLAHRR